MCQPLGSTQRLTHLELILSSQSIIMASVRLYYTRCHLCVHGKKQSTDKALFAPAPHTVAHTYIFPAFSSRAQSTVTSQLPDVKKRGGTEGMAGCVRQRHRDEEVDTFAD